MELEEACRDTRGLTTEDFKGVRTPVPQPVLPSKVILKFVCIFRFENYYVLLFNVLVVS